MSGIRLLERLTALEDPGRLAGVPPDRQLRDSVAQHLRRLLNTRLGSVPIDPDYGMLDMSNIAGSFALGTIESLTDEIVQQIVRYEPRLRNPRMTVEKEQRDVITLRFELQGVLASERTDGREQVFSLTLRVNSAGRVYVDPRVSG